MKVLLQYSEQSNHLFESTMGQSVHDNVQRVLNYLLMKGILIAPTDKISPDDDRVKLYGKSKEIIGQFWQKD